MRKQVLLMMAMLLMAVNGVKAQGLNWQWAKSAGTNVDDYQSFNVTDVGGNVYVTGSFSSPTITFGSFTLNNLNNSRNLFLVKYNANGNVVWAKNFGCSMGGGVNSAGVSIDGNGYIYVTGSFKTTLILGSFSLNSTNNSNDVYVAKFDTNGNVVWSISFQGSQEEWASSIATSPNNDVIVTGVFYDQSMTFGTYTLTDSFASNNSSEIFILKLDSSGNVVWAKSSHGGDESYGSNITTDASNNIIVTGKLWGGISFESIALITQLESSFFVVKMSANGNFLWGKTAGSSSSYSTDIKTDATGNVYVTGGYYDPFNHNNTLDFGSIVLHNTDTTGNTSDVFLVKYDPNGNIVWVKTAIGSKNEFVSGIYLDLGGNIYLGGIYNSSIVSFGSSVINNPNNAGSIFLAKYDINGNVLWAKSSGNVGNITHGSTSSMVGNSANGLYFLGNFIGVTCLFGSTTLTNMDNTGTTQDLFLAKLNLTTGIEEFPTSSISISPNPTTGQVTIKGITQPTVTVYNLMGQKVVASQGCNEVSLASLPAGMYIVQVFSKDMELVKSEKVIKE